MGKETALQIQHNPITLFKAKGYDVVTIDEICQVSGITRSTFYYHFPTKDRLLFDIFELSRTISPEATHILMTSENCWEKLWACLEPTLDWVIDVGPEIMSQVIIMNIQNKVDSLAVSEDPDIAKIYLAIIEKGQQTGQFENRSESKEIYNNLKNVTMGIELQWCISGGKFDHKDMVKIGVSSMLSVRKDLLK